MEFIETHEQDDIFASLAANASLCERLLKKGQRSFCIKTKLRYFDECKFFASSKDVHRTYFKSRNRDLIIYGLGAAHIVADAQPRGLIDLQFYVGGMRFDETATMGPEWQAFGQSFFVLPILQVIKLKEDIFFLMNFSADGSLPPNVWLDQALSLMYLYKNGGVIDDVLLNNVAEDCLPSKEEYVGIIHKALDEFKQTFTHKKVVIARRDVRSFSGPQDPISLFFRLQKKVKNGFGFFLDGPKSGAFFGISPELLYLRVDSSLKTESVAGTRPRAVNAFEDVRLSQELLDSEKDKYEHRFVSEHIEERLREFLPCPVSASALSVVSTDFVHHLIRKYEGTMASHIGDNEIINSLHPTPATCGFTKRWALDFIRTHENFDRGFYAGPVGVVGKNSAEFCVAIRSALYFQQKLYVYAGSGIVKGSDPLAEWEEINNKQKSIFTIFNG